MKFIYIRIICILLCLSVQFIKAQTLPPLTVELNYIEAPDLKEWAEEAALLAREQYPFLVAMLDSEGFVPPDSIVIIFREKHGVAYAAGNEIHISCDWIRRNPDDYGMVVHELIHVIQAFGSGNSVPGWVTEGIADYLRFFWWERNGFETCRVNPESARYTDSYRTTAAFFDWIVRTKDAGFIKRLNAYCREGNYSIGLFNEFTGMTVEELWVDFIKEIRNEE
jgi:hypothetical protein